MINKKINILQNPQKAIGILAQEKILKRLKRRITLLRLLTKKKIRRMTYHRFRNPERV